MGLPCKLEAPYHQARYVLQNCPETLSHRRGKACAGESGTNITGMLSG